MSQYSPLLINESPLQVLPTLAVAVGLNEALLLQQTQYRLQYSQVEFDGHKWIDRTAEQWKKKEFPFWSLSTIRRTIVNLEAKGLLISQKLNQSGYDQTKWYTINYEALNRMVTELLNLSNSSCSSCEDRFIQDEQLKLPKMSNSLMKREISKKIINTDVSPNGDTCSELQNSPEPEAIITIPLVGQQGEYAIIQTQINEWQEAYPAVDVPQELRNCRQWNLANPRKRKTRRGVLAHITGWLARKQDEGPRGDWRAKENPVSTPHARPGLNTKNTRNTRSIFDDDYASKDYQSGATRDEDLPQWARDALSE